MSTNFPTSLKTRPALPTGVAVPKASEASIAELLPFLHWAMDAIVALEAKVGVNSSAVSTSLDYKTRTLTKQYYRTPVIDLDNGAGVTIDYAFPVPSGGIVITDVRAVEVEEAAGIVAAGTFQVGSSLGGTQIVAATTYTNSLAVGGFKTGTVVLGSQTGTIFIRHTGVAATAAGKVVIEIEYRYQ